MDVESVLGEERRLGDPVPLFWRGATQSSIVDAQHRHGFVDLDLDGLICSLTRSRARLNLQRRHGARLPGV